MRMEDIMFEQFNHKKFNHCYTMGTRLNFNWDGTISLCHGIEVGDYIIGNIKENINKDWFEKKMTEILEKCENNDQNLLCLKCSNYKENYFEFTGINIITINTASICNCKCIYCGTWSLKSQFAYDVLPYLKELEAAGLIDEKCFFDWGGGEPLLNKYFEKTFRYLEKRKYIQRVNTNSLIYSDFLADALSRGNCILRTSLDAGNKYTFYKMKGLNCFEQTCQNIKKYAEVSSRPITVKYVLTSENSNSESINDFLDFCQSIKCKVILDADLNSYSNLNYHGPLFFSYKDLSEAQRFLALAKVRNIDISVGYVYTSNTETPGRDFNSIDDEKVYNYKIPDSLPKQISDKDIFCNNCYPSSYGSIDAMINLAGGNFIAYSDGLIGEIETASIKENGGNILHKYNRKYLNNAINGAVTLNVPLILCTEDYEGCMRKINNNANIDIKRLKIIVMDDFRYIEQEKGYKFKYIIIKIIKRLKRIGIDI